MTVLDADGTVRAGSGLAPPAGSSVYARLHPDDLDRVRSAVATVLAGGAVAGPVPFRLATGDGWFHGEATLAVVAGEVALDGAVIMTARHAPSPRPEGGRRAAVADAVGPALDAGQLRLVYQPKVEVLTGRIAAVEALLRWDHPELGSVPPAEFVPVAEATGLIVPIGAWVLEEACRQTALWQAAHPRIPPLGVQVNASADQLRSGLVDTVRQAVDRTGIDPATVVLEVTESTLMEDVEAAIAQLSDLRALGLGVSIDDFGTGYSSLQYLRRLPIDEVKIDRSFVAGVAEDPQDTAIVAAVISMSHAMERVVVAEGVETVAQLDRLRALGCELAQGYLLGRPMAPPALESLLTAEAAGRRLIPGNPPLSGSETVVVADDAADVRQLARMSLSAAGFAVEEAPDGPGAMALVRRLAAHCVVLDVAMPGLGGIEVCRRLRTDPATASCTVVMLTTSDAPHDKAAAFSAGADEYVVKPFAPRDLVVRVRSALARRNGGRPQG
ncbi:MAG TPA: EAL domain-containing protein [Acidimicrobiales bacterium]|nr:EAL domain-containing protein [Acidimicrobiales bacterium]